MATVSEKIKTIRLEMEITQKQLARMLYVSRGHVSELETGRKQPSEKVLNRINELYKSLPQIQVLTPKRVEVKKTWFDRFWNWILGWRG